MPITREEHKELVHMIVQLEDAAVENCLDRTAIEWAVQKDRISVKLFQYLESLVEK